MRPIRRRVVQPVVLPGVSASHCRNTLAKFPAYVSRCLSRWRRLPGAHRSVSTGTPALVAMHAWLAVRSHHRSHVDARKVPTVDMHAFAGGLGRVVTGHQPAIVATQGHGSARVVAWIAGHVDKATPWCSPVRTSWAHAVAVAAACGRPAGHHRRAPRSLFRMGASGNRNVRHGPSGSVGVMHRRAGALRHENGYMAE